MKYKEEITIIGAGAVGNSIAFALLNHGISVAGIYSAGGHSARRTAKKILAPLFGTVSEIQELHGTVIIAVPDSQIGVVAGQLARKQRSFKGTSIFHLSGALHSSELAVLKRRGASTGSFHPMQTFPKSYVSTFKDIWCAIEGDAAATRAMKQLGKILGAHVFAISKEEKVLYHAAGVFASNYIVVLLAVVEEIASKLKLSRKDVWKLYLPIVMQTINNVVSVSPVKALTGPIVRGDVGTVKNHLKALSKGSLGHLTGLYSSLGVEAARIAKKQHDR